MILWVSCPVDLGFCWLRWFWSVYFRVSRMGALISSKARRWVAVGRVILSKVVWPRVMVLRVRVAMCSSRLRKLCSGLPGVGGLVLNVGGWSSGGDGIVAGGSVFVGVGQRGERGAEMPGEVASAHADQHMGADR